MEPTNYSIGVDTPNPAQAFTDSFKNGASLLQMQQQQTLAKDQIQRKLDLQKDLSTLGSSPTPQAIASLSGKYPELSEHFKRSYDMLGAEQQKSKLDSAVPVYAAVASGKYDVAFNEMNRHADALENSGNKQEADQTRAMAQLVRDHPETAKVTMGLLLSSTMGPDKFASTFGSLGQEGRAAAEAPYDLQQKQNNATKTGYDADKSRIDAGYLPQEKEEKIKNDQFKRQIDSLDIQLKQANSETDRGRLQLERDKLVSEQSQKGLDKSNIAQDQLDATNQALGTIDSIRKHPALDPYLKIGDVGIGGGIGSVTGSMASVIPGSDAKDIRSMVDTLKSQQFLSAVQKMKGMGSLSDAEGKKIETATSSLDTSQSSGQFKTSLGVIENVLKKAQSRLLSSGNAPSQGGAFVTKHPTFGNIKEGDINRMIAANPSATREQAIQYLQQTGAGGNGNTGAW